MLKKSLTPGGWLGLAFVLAVLAIDACDKTEKISFKDIRGYASSAVATGDGGCLVAGGTGFSITPRTDGRNDHEMLVVKLDKRGSVEWERLFPNSMAVSVFLLPDQNFMIVGWMGTYFDFGYLYLMKMNSAGDSLWTKQYSTYHPTGSIITENSGLIITGTHNDQTFLMKTDSNGDSVWVLHVSLPYYKISAGPGSNFLMTGISLNDLTNYPEARVLIFNEQGNVTEDRIVISASENNQYNEPSALAYTHSTGDILVSLMSSSACTIAKTNSGLTTQWSANLWSPAQSPYITCITETRDNNFLLAGGIDPNQDTYYQEYSVALSKVTSGGAVEWSTIIPEKTGMTGGATAVIKTSDDGYLITTGNGNVMKVDEKGNRVW